MFKTKEKHFSSMNIVTWFQWTSDTIQKRTPLNHMCDVHILNDYLIQTEIFFPSNISYHTHWTQFPPAFAIQFALVILGGIHFFKLFRLDVYRLSYGVKHSSSLQVVGRCAWARPGRSVKITLLIKLFSSLLQNFALLKTYNQMKKHTHARLRSMHVHRCT